MSIEQKQKLEAEGGCGVIGLACEKQIAGKHLIPPLVQMCNRGNGKGGGIAAVGLDPTYFGVTQEILENNYLIAIAYIDITCRHELEQKFIHPVFNINHAYTFSPINNYQEIGLEIKPPDVIVYFGTIKPSVIEEHTKDPHLVSYTPKEIEDEIVYRNTYHLNLTYYASEGKQRAFVLTHSKNMLVLKIVGFGEQVIQYYKLEEFVAHVWIGHHRYPTKGKVWHPGGAHPFVGLNEALVHNGDFANYSSICEYLAQRDIKPLFLTDTEVSVLLFDLLYRVYRYPLEYVIEALAPTTDRDFNLLPKNKQDIYQYIQKTHMHGSPDGPWFFLIAQSLTQERLYRLIGITDTSMLRPQVFALQKGPLAIGCSASEKQAIDVCLQSISKEDNRFWPVADYYWSARGGSYTDGGAFSFTVIKENGKPHLSCTDKFFKEIHPLFLKAPYIQTSEIPFKESFQKVSYTWLKQKLKEWNYGDCIGMLKALEKYASENDTNRTYAFSLLTKLIDSNYPTGKLRQSSLKALFLETFNQIASRDTSSQLYSYMKWGDNTPKFHHSQQILIINAVGFPAQGNSSLAENLIRAYKNGFVNFIVFNCHGQRFIGNGFGENSRGVTIDVYGSSGDYLASGIDGADIYVHGSGQDQLAQIMNEGTLVIYGDVGQTFMYGAKGGKAFIKGNAAGRPLINAVGKPRVVINGTCLDYLAESFMAGHPLHEGGFVIVNGIHFDEEGRIVDLEIPYPGGNLFSLASGGAVYIRDPLHKLSDDQLNGGQFSKMTLADWELILPYLEENERYFDIPVTRLTQHGDIQMTYEKIYRKIMPGHVKVLQEEELWVKERV